MSILLHPEWPMVRRFVHIELCGNDRGPTNRPRHRIEVKVDTGKEKHDQEVTNDLIALTMPCVECGKPIHPIRARNGSNKRGWPRHLYYACACPLHINISCSRGAKAHAEYVRVREDVEQWRERAKDHGSATKERPIRPR